MKHYIVFAAQPETYQDGYIEGPPRTYVENKRPTGRLLWQGQPVGVFRGESAEQACQAAARKAGVIGTFFAIEGFPWGVSLLHTVAEELTMTDPAEETRLAQLEKRSRKMEREAGIDQR